MATFKTGVDTAGVLKAKPEGTGRPINDRSAEILAGGVNTAIKAGNDIAKAAAVAPLEQNIESQLNDFSTARLLNPSGDSLAQSLQDAADDIETAKGADNQEGVNAATTEFEKLDRMRKLGNLSSSQVQLQAEATLRRAVNENPFFRDELIGAHDTILGLHRKELAAIDALDSAKSKQDKTIRNGYIAILQKKGESVIGLSDSELAAKAIPIQLNKAAYDDMKQSQEVSEIKARNWFFGDNGNALKGSYDTYNEEVAQAIIEWREVGGGNVDSISATIENIAQERKAKLSSVGLRFGLNTAVTKMEDTFDDATSIWIDSLSNKRTNEQVQNRLNIMKNRLQSGALQNNTIKTLYLLDTFAGNFIENNALFRNGVQGSLAKNSIDYFTALSSGFSPTQVPPTGAEQKKAVQQTGLFISNEISTSTPQSPEQWNEVYDVVDGMASVVSTPGRDYTNEEVNNVLSIGSLPQIVERVNSDPAFAPTAEKLRLGTEALLDDVVIPSIGSELQQTLKGSIVSTQFDKGSSNTGPLRDFISLDTSDTGVVTFKVKGSGLSNTELGQVQSVVDRLNKKQAVRLNKAIRTLAHVNGTTDYASAVKATFGRLNIGLLPELTGSVTLASKPTAEPTTAAAPTRPTDNKSTVDVTELGTPQLRKLAQTGNRAASIELFDRQEGFSQDPNEVTNEN